MTNEMEEATPRRRIRLWHILTALVFLLIVGVVVRQWHGKRVFRQRVAAIAAAGYPVTLTELNAWYVQPESGDNAAEQILTACSYYQAPAEKADEELLWSVVHGRESEPLSEDVRTALAQHVAANVQALELLHAAAEIEQSRYPVDFKKGYAITLSHMGDVINKAEFLAAVELAHYVAQEDADGVVRSMRTCLGIAHSLAAEPWGLSQINRVTCLSLAFRGLEQAMTHVVFADEQLVRLDKLVATAYRPEAWARAAIGERCAAIALYENPDMLDPSLFGPGLPPRFVGRLQKTVGITDRDGIRYLELMHRYLDIRQLPRHERLAAARAIDADRNALSSTFSLLHEFGWPAEAFVRRELNEMALVQTARAALAMERYRLAHGTLPKGVDGLVPAYLDAVPTDPFDGEPLRHKALDPGFVVYSIGRDGVDDGGKRRIPSKARKSDETYDIPFTVAR